MDIFIQNQHHQLPARQVTKVIDRQPWGEAEKETVKNIFLNYKDTHGNISGEKLSFVFQHLQNRPEHGIAAHHLHQFQKQLEHPFQQTLAGPAAKVSTPRLRL